MAQSQIEPFDEAGADLESQSGHALGVDIDTATLYARLGLSADIPPATALKDLEKIVEGFEVSVVRDVVDVVLVEAGLVSEVEQIRTVVADLQP